MQFAIFRLRRKIIADFPQRAIHKHWPPLHRMRFSLLIILGLLTGCISNSTETKSEELNILNQLFIELVGTDRYFLPLPTPTMPLGEEASREDSLRFEKEQLDLEQLLKTRKLDTSVLKIYLHDSLINYDGDDLEELLGKTNFKANFPVDTTWIDLIKKLNRIESPIGFDINQITKTGNFTLVSKLEFNDTTDNKTRVGALTMSRVALSHDQKRGVFYYDFICGGLCGGGSLIFIERIGTEWKIVEERVMWVS